MAKRIISRFAVLCFTVFFASALFPAAAKAEGGVLTDSVWEHLFTAYAVDNGLIQSICVTDQYIITLENVEDSADTLDVVTAYYRFDYDQEGNPVERYSIANRVRTDEWEHCNGMCWNPNTNEIYVALYTNTIPENRGCLYVMDPETLQKTGRIKVTDDFNVLAIAYDNANDRYYIQTNADKDFSVMILDSSFQIVEDLGAEPADPGYNFQDFSLVGDYLLQFPLTWNMDIGEYMMAYSISQRSVVDTIQLFFDELPDEQYIEPESVAWLEGDSFIVPVNATSYDGSRRCLFYRVVFPHLGLAPVEEETEETEETQIVSAVSTTSYAAAVSEVSTTEVTTAEVSETAGITEAPEEDSVNVTKGNQELTQPVVKEKKPVPKAVIVVILLIIALAAAGVFYAKYVQRERAKREARMRRARRKMMARVAREEAEKEAEEFDLEETLETIEPKKKRQREEDPELEELLAWLEQGERSREEAQMSDRFGEAAQPTARFEIPAWVKDLSTGSMPAREADRSDGNHSLEEEELSVGSHPSDDEDFSFDNRLGDE